jgi:nucleotide-binding universal stress UspA family protein
MKPVRTILHPTDFSGPAAAALDLAAALARDQHARLVVLHVVPGEAHYTGAGDVSAIRRAECAEQDLKTYRDEMGERLRRLQPAGKISVEHMLTEGDAATEIVRVAEESAADLIVIGCRGKSAEAKRMMGSVTEAVQRRAPCPVVTARLAIDRSVGGKPDRAMSKTSP